VEEIESAGQYLSFVIVAWLETNKPATNNLNTNFPPSLLPPSLPAFLSYLRAY
jgi:hypothetical protein